MLEKDYQYRLVKKIEKDFPGAVIFKNDPQLRQGICDLLILYGPLWGMLEVKRSREASHRPNQDFYVNKFDAMGFAKFIYPSNEREVLNELERSLLFKRFTLVP